MRGVKRGWAIVMVMVAASVAASQPTATARVETGGACELTTLAPRSNELLGREAVASGARARVTVSVVQAFDAYVATVAFIDESGVEQSSRTISAKNCDELAESVAIVI